MSLYDRASERYEKTLEISKHLYRDHEEFWHNNPELADLNLRLFVTPQFVWDAIFKSEGYAENFWKKALEATQRGLTLDLAIQTGEQLQEACDPEIDKRTVIDLDTVIPQPQRPLEYAFGHLEEQLSTMMRSSYAERTAAVMSHLGTEEIPLIRYPREMIDGKFNPQKLANGGVLYRLPTSLEAVHIDLIYPMQNRYPVSRIIVNPIASLFNLTH